MQYYDNNVMIVKSFVVKLNLQLKRYSIFEECQIIISKLSLPKIQEIITDLYDKLLTGYLLMVPIAGVFSIDKKKSCNYCISHLSSLVCNCSTTTGLRLATICLMLTISHGETDLATFYLSSISQN